MPLNDTLFLMSTQAEAQLLEAKLARKRLVEANPRSQSPRAPNWRSIAASAWRALKPAPERRTADLAVPNFPPQPAKHRA